MVDRQSVKMCAAVVREILRDPLRTPDEVWESLECSRAAFYNYKRLLQEHFGFVFAFDRKQGRFFVKEFGLFAASPQQKARHFPVKPLLPDGLEIRECKTPGCKKTFVVRKEPGFGSRKFCYACRQES